MSTAYKLMAVLDSLEGRVDGVLASGDEGDELHCRGQASSVSIKGICHSSSEAPAALSISNQHGLGAGLVDS